MFKKPSIIVFSGPPCSGKTHLANLFSEKTGLLHVEMDEIRKIILPNSDMRPEHREIAYRAMHFVTGVLLDFYKSGIVNATYQPFSRRQELDNLVHEKGGDLFLIQCKVAPEAAVERFISYRQPGHAAIDLTPEKVYQLAGVYRYCKKGLVLDTTHDSPTTSLSKIEEYLESAISLAPGEWTKEIA